MNEIPNPEKMLDFSKITLQDLIVSSLNRSTRHLKAARAAWNEAVREEAIAIAAQWFLENREDLIKAVGLVIAPPPLPYEQLLPEHCAPDTSGNIVSRNAA